MAATWWDESVHELQTAASRGWKAVIEAWLTTAEASQDNKGAPDLADQVAVRLLASSQLAHRAGIAADLARIDVEITATKASGNSYGTVESGEHIVSPAELSNLESLRSEAKKVLTSIDASLLATARDVYASISVSDAPNWAIGTLRNRMRDLVMQHFDMVKCCALAWYDELARKYGSTLRETERRRSVSAARLEQNLAELGYV